MLTKIARNDVVRLTASGEVGTVDGWADHNKINGTVLDVRFSTRDVRTLTGDKLEFVAHAKPPVTTTRTVMSLVMIVLSMAGGVWVGFSLNGYGVPVFSASVQGFITAWLWLAMFGIWSRPRKTSVRQPVRRVAQGRNPSVSK